MGITMSIGSDANARPGQAAYRAATAATMAARERPTLPAPAVTVGGGAVVVTLPPVGAT